MSDNTEHLQALVQRAVELGAVRSKNGNGFIIFTDDVAERNEIAMLAKSAGKDVVDSPQPTFFQGRQLPPRIWVGKRNSNVSAEEKKWIWSWVGDHRKFFRDHVENMTRQHIYRMLLDLYLRVVKLENSSLRREEEL